jgi:hypothetical protein
MSEGWYLRRVVDHMEPTTIDSPISDHSGHWELVHSTGSLALPELKPIDGKLSVVTKVYLPALPLIERHAITQLQESTPTWLYIIDVSTLKPVMRADWGLVLAPTGVSDA